MANEKTTGRRTPEICPVCGEEVPRGARACPECGADERSGWREEPASYDGAGIGDEDFDYEEFVQEEFGKSPRPRGIHPLWWITAILLFAALVMIYFRGR